ncbi:Uncharacterised protein [Moraxella lacunata]|uniref:Uncharacterized protein n=1 Tax=Moraxella lacunata TaxID=477 RepID=A0A378TPI7_MORLA|nr:Uncharacterised protein [Moraxella lacunata]
MSAKSKIWIDTPEQLDLLKQRGLVIQLTKIEFYYENRLPQACLRVGFRHGQA